MDVTATGWAALLLVVFVFLSIDLFFFALRDEVVSLKQATIASILWTGIGFAFTIPLLILDDARSAGEYLTGFVLEKSLSVDNLFVFALIFSYFKIPAQYQRRVMFWGIVGAIILRATFIAAGAAVLDAFHWMIFVFGAFLIIVGIRMVTHDELDVHPEDNPVLKLISRFTPITPDQHGHDMFIRRDGHRYATPLFAALVLVAFFDAVFALDSIPAIFGVTREVFIVAAANAFSLLGLAALYFTLVGMLERFKYLSVGIAVVLVLVGVKMIVGEFVHIPEAASLGAVLGILTVTVVVSLRADGRAQT